MKGIPGWAVLVLSTLALGACVRGPESPRGFRLPDGDAAAGQALFVELGCHECHTIRGVDLPPATGEQGLSVALGGQVSRVKTYGDLVTAIINPSHKLAPGYRDAVTESGESLMTVYNDRMTVQQLIDLVAYLQPTYEVVPPQYEYYDYGP